MQKAKDKRETEIHKVLVFRTGSFRFPIKTLPNNQGFQWSNITPPVQTTFEKYGDTVQPTLTWLGEAFKKASLKN